MTKQFRLLTPTGPQLSEVPGALGGNSKAKIYGRLDCSAALGALPQGYAKQRVFFADEAAAIACGYRPCGSCMRKEYAAWKAAKQT
jgi:methylphosphotriester-DNA--protein-cysteine methyltransferase